MSPPAESPVSQHHPTLVRNLSSSQSVLSLVSACFLVLHSYAYRGRPSFLGRCAADGVWYAAAAAGCSDSRRVSFYSLTWVNFWVRLQNVPFLLCVLYRRSSSSAECGHFQACVNVCLQQLPHPQQNVLREWRGIHYTKSPPRQSCCAVLQLIASVVQVLIQENHFTPFIIVHTVPHPYSWDDEVALLSSQLPHQS